MWKYVQLCLFLFNFAKYKQEKTEIGIKDYNSCDKLQNSLTPQVAAELTGHRQLPPSTDLRIKHSIFMTIP